MWWSNLINLLIGIFYKCLSKQLHCQSRFRRSDFWYDSFKHFIWSAVISPAFLSIWNDNQWSKRTATNRPLHDSHLFTFYSFNTVSKSYIDCTKTRCIDRWNNYHNRNLKFVPRLSTHLYIIFFHDVFKPFMVKSAPWAKKFKTHCGKVLTSMLKNGVRTASASKRFQKMLFVSVNVPPTLSIIVGHLKWKATS